MRGLSGLKVVNRWKVVKCSWRSAFFNQDLLEVATWQGHQLVVGCHSYHSYLHVYIYIHIHIYIYPLIVMVMYIYIYHISPHISTIYPWHPHIQPDCEVRHRATESVTGPVTAMTAMTVTRTLDESQRFGPCQWLVKMGIIHPMMLARFGSLVTLCADTIVCPKIQRVARNTHGNTKRCYSEWPVWL